MASVPVGMDLYLPALLETAHYFQVPLKDLSITVPLFFLGNTLGQFVGGPLSDQIGRRRVGIFGLSLCLLCCIGMVFAPSVTAIKLLRGLQGIGAGAAAVIAMPTLRDLYEDTQIGPKIAGVLLVVMVSQVFAPFVGAALLHISWQSVFVVMSILTATVLGCYLWLLSETAPYQTTPSAQSFFRNYAKVFGFRHRGYLIALRYILIMATTMSVTLTFVISSVFIYRQYFGLDQFGYSLLFPLTILSVAICTGYSRMRMKRGCSSFRSLGLGLRMQLLAAAILVITCATSAPTLALVAPPLILAGGFVGLVIPHCMTLYLRFFDATAGSATSSTTASNFLLGGIVGGSATYFQDNSLLPTATIMLGASIVANVLYLTIPASVHSKQ